MVEPSRWSRVYENTRVNKDRSWRTGGGKMDRDEEPRRLEMRDEGTTESTSWVEENEIAGDP